ncbi:LON peptidase substrate-binding domain-containing protein [Cognataquiflexum rubidum]|uniref:LON peptidase substrate-binding domain-containing protein n=1 Tax=Cognataquiflexum rubidum TaxID=2922273 RepID=UPI001F12BDBF|nr:LON peptidase substrate-binding domain-containing protein [Cognataquiflexum rubidum]MCH6235543.1 LON peptidase substrate-binding domain-containing protein [Cognataquiflexum rubidum]
MGNFIPLFPLKLVAFPGEQLNLHIFEPRYKQLIKDIEATKGSFGIAVYIDKLMPFGTEVELEEVSKVYDDGRMDIKTRCKRVFEMLSFENPMADKMYAGGNVVFHDNDPRVGENQYAEFIFYLKELFRLMDFQTEIIPLRLNSFTYAHKLGLNLTEEYELLLMTKESERIIFLIRHMMKIIPIMRDIEIAKKKIQMNGHFKNLEPLDF